MLEFQDRQWNAIEPIDHPHEDQQKKCKNQTIRIIDPEKSNQTVEIWVEINQKPSGYICNMGSVRQQKMSRMVQKELGDLFLRWNNELFHGKMCTITQVKMSPDLGLAKVYLSIFPNKDAEGIFETLELRKSEIRRQFGNQIGKRARKIPEIAFFHDEIEEQASSIDKLIDSLDIPPAPEE